MGEVVHHRHAVRHAAHLLAAPYALERIQRRLDGGGRVPRRGGGVFQSRDQRDHGGGVECIVASRHGNAPNIFPPPAFPQLERAALSIGAPGRQPPLGFRPEAIARHLAGGLGQQPPHVGIVRAGDHAPPGGHGAQQPRELGADRVQVRVDVRVVELQRGENQRARFVLEEFGRLVEVGRVVLVALDHE